MTTIKSVALCGALTLGVFTASSPAYAYLQCGPGRIDIGNPGPEQGRVIETDVAIDNNVWTILHKLADGTVVDRSTQYGIANTSTATTLQWRGSLDVNPALTMIGKVGNPMSNSPSYQEWLYKDGKVVMHSWTMCSVIQQADATAPASQPVAQPPAASASGGDFVPLIGDGTKLFALVTLGTQPSEIMQIDTGASSLVVTNSIANALIASGEATEGDPSTAQIADGSVIQTREITINQITIGNHTITGVPASVAPNAGGMLIGLPILSQFGRFTIDTANRRLIFG